ncbi:unnamed protein product [Pedinophyceae sp. YPF-701]|nr:unnamed protein product [Pedinophyceae sp. YPF-701]
MGVEYFQSQIGLPAFKRGCHLVTDKIIGPVSSDLRKIKAGLCHVFIQHTSASLTINENCDPDVRHDMETWMSKVVPEGSGAPWRHTDEGPDDMPAHVKASVMGPALSIPVRNGQLALGTWQGIWLCEHRDCAGGRKVVVTIQGATQ